jgi:DNA-binding XRE family transcriptional regulator
MSFGATLVLRKLRQLRENAGITQQQLATATGLPLQDVVSIEQGRTKVQMSTATAIANALKVSLAELLK